MGIDGTQYITIRGSKSILDEIENSKLKLENVSELISQIANAFFGDENVEVRCRDERFLVFRTYFRNRPIKEYMLEILKKYPTCWIKYEYSTEDGYYGLWTGRTNRGSNEPVITDIEWNELSWDEIGNLEDFSVSLPDSYEDSQSTADDGEDEAVIPV